MASSRIDAIPESHRALLDGPIVFSLATQMKSDQIQVQRLWCSYDGGQILVNADRGCSLPLLHQVGARRAQRCPPVARHPKSSLRKPLVFRGFQAGRCLAWNLQILIPEAGGNGRRQEVTKWTWNTAVARDGAWS